MLGYQLNYLLNHKEINKPIRTKIFLQDKDIYSSDRQNHNLSAVHRCQPTDQTQELGPPGIILSPQSRY